MTQEDIQGKRVLKNYSFSLLLIASILIGSLVGIFFKDQTRHLKPLGDIFLNLLFTAVVPLVFLSISSSVAGMSDLKRLGRILFLMLLLFAGTGLLSSSLMLVAVKIYPPAVANLTLAAQAPVDQGQAISNIVAAFTVPDFVHLLTRKNMLALMIFSIMVGLGASLAKERGKLFREFLDSGNAVMMKVIWIIMLYAPIGLGAYFAYLIGVFGPQLLGSYLRVIALYYPFSMAYFFIGFSFYALLAGGRRGLSTFWSKIGLASLTALGTGSSVATIPANIEAADEIGVPKDISRIVIPVGATSHMDGSCIAAMLKIALLFSFYHMKFEGAGTLLMALGVALLSGMVMPGIPAGGFVGELLIVTLYGFPLEALPLISMVGTLVDPPATAVNAIGSNVISMLIARILGGKNWFKESQEKVSNTL